MPDYTLAGIGRYFGYMNLLKTIVFEQDENIIEEIGTKIVVKPEELSLLERKLFESVYAYTKEGKYISNEFNFFEESFPIKLTTEKIKQKENLIRKKDFIIENKSFNILDTTIFFINFNNRIENLLKIIQKYYPEEIEILGGPVLSNILIRYDLFFYIGRKNKIFISKNNLLMAMKDSPQKFKTNISELEDAFDFDRKHGYIK